MDTKWSRVLFRVAALYEGALGIAFAFFARPIFEFYNVAPPNHYGYTTFPGLVLILFAAMYLQIAGDPARYRHMILYAVGLKGAYCLTALWYQLQGGIPAMWIPFAWADLAFLVLFLLAWRGAGRRAGAIVTS